MTTITRRPRPTARRAFTLVEVLIVVVILGILAAIVLPQFASATNSARHNAFITDLNALTKAVSAYTGIHGPPPDSPSGVMPTELSAYMNATRYERRTALGGVWDIEVEENGVGLAIGVHFNAGDNPGDEVMTRVDTLIDDGDLTTGGFRRIAADRYYNVLR